MLYFCIFVKKLIILEENEKNAREDIDQCHSII